MTKLKLKVPKDYEVVRNAAISGSWHGWQWSFVRTGKKKPCGGEGCQGDEGGMWGIDFMYGGTTIPLAMCTREHIQSLGFVQVHWNGTHMTRFLETIEDLARLTKTHVPGIYDPEKDDRK